MQTQQTQALFQQGKKNAESMQQNAQAMQQNAQALEQMNKELQEKVDQLVQYEQEKIEEKKRKQEIKEKRLKRKRKPKTQPFTIEDANDLLQSIKGHTYVARRNRCAFVILSVTGVQISELLNAKSKHINTLVNHGFITLDRQK